MNKHGRLITALILGMATLSLPTRTTAAVTVDIVGASLLARGAGVSVAVAVPCSAPLPEDSVLEDLDVDVIQRAGRFTTGGEGFLVDRSLNNSTN